MRWTRSGPAVLAMLVGLVGRGTPAQEYRPTVPGAYPRGPAMGAMSSARGGLTGTDHRPNPDPGGVRRVQATPEDAGPPIPGEGVETPLPLGVTPEPSTTDLSLPAAEREFGGGEPTEVVREAEAAEAADEEEEGTLLMNVLGMQDSPIKIYGWIQNSFTGNPSQPSDGVNFGVTPNYKANEWMGNQYYTIIENPIEQTDEVNFGFRIDSLFGHDWQFNKMIGLFDEAFNPGQFAGWDPAQFYAEVHLPVLTRGGVDIKGGRMYTLAGYEVVPAIGRPLLSVPYMFTFGQPFTHFGMMSTWHVTDRLNIHNCAINGWDRWINQNFKWGYMGGFSWTSKNAKLGLTSILVWGPNQYPFFFGQGTTILPTGYAPAGFLAGRRNRAYPDNDRTLFTTVLTYQWTDKLLQVIETDQAFEDDVPGIGAGGTSQNAEWYSFGNWFLYSFNDKWTGVWRSEVFRDDDGARTGFATNFSEITLGLIYKPVPYIWIRPEARYDWARSGTPYNGGNSNSQFTIGLDAILLY